MKQSFAFRALSIMLVLCLCLSALPSFVFATSESNFEINEDLFIETIYSDDWVMFHSEYSLDPAAVPEIIGYEAAIENGHIGRVYEDEGTNLNKVVFLNSDGSKTMYLFDFPVKYVDETGNIKDIQLTITDSNTDTNKYQTAANSIITKFPEKFLDGICLSGNDTEVRLVPIQPIDTVITNIETNNLSESTLLNATAQYFNENTVAYSYDTNTTIEYSLTYSGFKEDIVVSEYTGQTEYPFRLYTNGLSLTKIEGSYFLTDSYGDIRATIGDIIIYTADERNNTFGDIIPTTIVENEEYLLTIVVDADYLTDPNTVYPIRIDPTVEIDYNDGTSVIEDITITTNTNYTGSHTSLYVGRRSTEGIARALMRFPGLDLAELENATVTSASVRVRDLMCEDTPLDISCHIFTGDVWDANSAIWTDVSPNSYISPALSTNTLSWSIGDTFDPIHWYYFDITSAVQGWIDSEYDQDKGIIFKASSAVENGSTIANRTFGSFNRASYKPSMSMTYYDGVTSVVLSPSNITMTAGNTRTLTATIYPESAGNKNLSWSTSNSAIARISTSGVVTAVSPGTATITCTSLDGGHKATCTVTVNPNSYTAMTEGTNYAVTISKGKHVWFSFTPSVTGYYMFRSTSDTGTDVKAYLYNGTTYLDDSDDDAKEYRQFEIRYRLEAGKTYRLKVQGYSTITTGSCRVSVNQCWPEAEKPDIKSRSQWGAAAVVQERLVARTREPERIIFHHSADKFSSTNLNDCINEIKRIQNLHMNGDPPKCDIAYHFIIDPAGRIWQGAEIDNYQRGHATGHFDDIGVLVLGDFESRLANWWQPNTLNDNQKEAMIKIAKWLCYEYEIPISATNGPITTHRQVNPGSTVCPGDNMAPWVENDLLNLIVNWRK